MANVKHLAGEKKHLQVAERSTSLDLDMWPRHEGGLGSSSCKAVPAKLIVLWQYRFLQHICFAPALLFLFHSSGVTLWASKSALVLSLFTGGQNYPFWKSD